MRRPRPLPQRALGALLAAAVCLPSLSAQSDDAPAAAGQVTPETPLDQLKALLEQQLGEAPMAQPTAAALPAATPIGQGENTGFSLAPNNLIEFHARNIDVAEAFAQLRQLARRNIVVSPDVNARFTGDLFDLEFDQILEVITTSTDLLSREQDGFIYIEPMAYETELFTLRHTRAADLVELLTPLLGDGGQAVGTAPSKVGIVASQEEAGGDDYAHAEMLLVRAYPPALEQVRKVIEVVDAQPQQVLVEATIFIAQLNDEMELGVNLSAISGASFADLNTTSDGSTISPGTIPPALIDEGITTYASQVGSGISTGGLNVGYLTGSVAGFLRAVQTVTSTSVLANTKITTVNKQRGEVLLGRRDGFRTTTTTQTSTTEEVEFLETGTRLIFRPFILDNGYVRLEVHPEDSEGGINADGLPFEETAEVTTNVMVRSGEMVVIGGLFRERIRSIETKVPLLGDIPLIGWLFRSTRDELRREEIIVLLRPHIIDFSKGPLAAMPGLGDPTSPTFDTLQLFEAYLRSADDLIGRGNYGSAALILDEAESLGHRSDDVEYMNDRLWDEYVPDFAGATVDQRILEQVLDREPTDTTDESP